MVEIRPEQILNPATGRYVLRSGKIGKKILEDMKKSKESPKKASASKASASKASTRCKPDEIINPKTNRCVKKKGKIGRELSKNKKSSPSSPKNNPPKKASPKKTSARKAPSECRPDQIINPRTGKCVLRNGKIGKQILEDMKKKEQKPKSEGVPFDEDMPVPPRRQPQPYSHVPPPEQRKYDPVPPKQQKPQPPPKQAPPKKQKPPPKIPRRTAGDTFDEFFGRSGSTFEEFFKRFFPNHQVPPRAQQPQYQAQYKPEKGFGNLDKAFPDPDDVRHYRSSKIFEEAHNILGVPLNTKKPEIKKAYYKLAQQYHPDKGGDSKIFTKISSAWNYLEKET